MIDIIVTRENAIPHKHEDIVDPKIGSILCAIFRGKAVLDEEGTGLQSLTYETVLRTDLQLGMLVDIEDPVLGEIFRAKITGIEHVIESVNGAVVKTTFLKIKKPTNFVIIPQ